MEWNFGRRAALVMLSLAFLAGCAQVPRQAFNAQAAAHVKTLVVAHAENQVEYPVQIIGHPGMSFGLIGGLVAAADMQVKTGKLTSAIDVKETRVQERFAEKLKERLNKAGYETVVVVLPKGTTLDQGLVQARQKAKGDAIVVVDLYAGYWAAGPSTDYFPRMVAKVKTFDARSDKVLYEDSISYGYAMPQAQTVHLASEPTYRFASIDTLTADPVKTRQGLYVGADALAEQIVNDLRKN
ncbi:MAG: hypothetical protein JWP22_405 [Ramlibacter sp.]|jgi:nucleotide-binding universal stress UspA family protein|nr:hypothetical protein [Ramlibacter sp.]MDB5911730.1 hypothetical protein [Ramlibacter sp.]